jgi:hypothetical protein
MRVDLVSLIHLEHLRVKVSGHRATCSPDPGIARLEKEGMPGNTIK